MASQKKSGASPSGINTVELVLLSVGSMIGSGWLFAPFLSFRNIGAYAVIAWLLAAIIVAIIGLAFAELSCMIPLIGGISRFLGVSHNRSSSFIFFVCAWVSYIAYLPIEATSTVRYLGFWCGDLVHYRNNAITLSVYGYLLSIVIMLAIGYLNTLLIEKVTKINLVVSICKVVTPIAVIIIVIVLFLYREHAPAYAIKSHLITPETILYSISSSGMIFAFIGFHNGLILANNAQNKSRAIPLSIFLPILIGVVFYLLLTIGYIVCMHDIHASNNHIAPLLGLVGIFGIHWIYVVLLINAIIAPMSTANVYTAVTARLLYAMTKIFYKKSHLILHLNKNKVPIYCLWLNIALGVILLFVFPTWRAMMNFVSAITIFTYLAGPITFLSLRLACPYLPRVFHLPYHRLIGYSGFVLCTLIIYWTNNHDIILLLGLVLLSGIIYLLSVKKSAANLDSNNSLFMFIALCIYLAVLYIFSCIHSRYINIFPWDQIGVVIVALACCRILVSYRLSNQDIYHNLTSINKDQQRNNH